MHADFEVWWTALRDLAAQHGENVLDLDAWKEEYDKGLTPEIAFFNEYPEHQEQS